MNMEHVNTDSPVRLASTASFVVMLLAAFATPSRAQRTAADSLEERLRRAEAALAALQVQVSEQASAGVATRSGARLEISGTVLVKAFGNSRRVNNVDNAQFVLPDLVTTTFVDRGMGLAIRETRLGLRYTVPGVLGGTFTGDMDVDFNGGVVPSSGGRTFPLIRLRTARGVVRWGDTHLLIGQESPLIAGLNPATLASVGTPTFAAAGNLWLWLPQLRVGTQRGSRVRYGFQGAVLAPTSGDPGGPFDTDNDVAERSQRPFLQARAHVAFGADELTREIGCGVHQGWLVPLDATEKSRAFACDALLPITERFELRGEYFTGQGLRGLGGGGIGQNTSPATATPPNKPLETSGGWLQLNASVLTSLRVGAGCGGDHPEALATRRRNDACAAHAIVRPGGPVFFGVEARRIRTAYGTARYINDHVTAAFGFEF
jgi:hypothetical protein